jgi:hypothetical protein
VAHSTSCPAGMAPLSQMTCGICKGMDITDLARSAEALKRSFLTPFPQAEVGRQWRPRRALFQVLDFTNGATVHAALFLHVEGDPDPRPSSSPCRDWGAPMMPSTIEAFQTGREELWPRRSRAWEQASRQGQTRSWHMSQGDVWQDSIERTTDPFTLVLRLQVSQHGPPNQYPAGCPAQDPSRPSSQSRQESLCQTVPVRVGLLEGQPQRRGRPPLAAPRRLPMPPLHGLLRLGNAPRGPRSRAMGLRQMGLAKPSGAYLAGDRHRHRQCHPLRLRHCLALCLALAHRILCEAAEIEQDPDQWAAAYPDFDLAAYSAAWRLMGAQLSSTVGLLPTTSTVFVPHTGDFTGHANWALWTWTTRLVYTTASSAGTSIDMAYLSDGLKKLYLLHGQNLTTELFGPQDPSRAPLSTATLRPLHPWPVCRVGEAEEVATNTEQPSAIPWLRQGYRQLSAGSP